MEQNKSITGSINLARKPYLVVEHNKGEFRIVKSLEVESNCNYKLNCIADILNEGLDLRECPNKSIDIYIKCENDERVLIENVINKLRDFAYIGGYDFYSFESIKRGIFPIDDYENGYMHAAVRPRIFRKLVK